VSVLQAGHQEKFTLENVHYIPVFYSTIFSLTMAIKKGCKILNENTAIIVNRNLF